MKKHIIMSVLAQFLFIAIAVGQSFTFHSVSPFGIQVAREDSSRAAQKMIFFDYDGDGDQDLLLSGLAQIEDFDSWNGIHFFLEIQENTGDRFNPQFAPRDSSFEMLSHPRGYFLPAIGDLNNDGFPDFILGSDIDYIGNQTFLYAKGLGNFSFESNRLDSMGLDNFVAESAFQPELVDLDQDGDLDLLASGFTSAFAEESGPDIPIFYYAKNVGSKNVPSFDGWYFFPYGLFPDPNIEMLTSGDIDNDGDVDFIGVTSKIPADSLSHVYVHLNHPDNGKPVFDTISVASPFGLPTTFGETQLLAPDMVDIDGDGDLDLFVFEVAVQGFTLKYYENNLCIPTTTDLSQTICEGDIYTVGNESFSEPGEYDVHLLSIQHCDSLVHLILDVLGPVSSNVDATICEGESYTVANETFTATGNYMVHTVTAAGCDSLIFLTLIVHPNSNTAVEESICNGQSITVGGETFSVSGDYSINLVAANGCDSTVFLHLQVNPLYESDVAATICEGQSYEIGNQPYTSPGIYIIPLQSQAGCDSVITLTLTVNPNLTTSLNESRCAGESVQVGNEVFSTTGHYEVHLNSQAGCDSLVQLDLVITTIDTSVTIDQNSITANQTGATYEWFDCNGNNLVANSQTFTASVSGSYFVAITINNCSASSACFPIVISALDNDYYSNAIHLYPNPTTGRVYIKLDPSLSITDLEVLTATGYSTRIEKTDLHSIDLTGYAKGMYFIRMRVNERIIIKKIVLD